MHFFYITVKIRGKKYFVNKDMDYTDSFNNILEFSSFDDAENYIIEKLSDKDTNILEYIE